jgi:hypothetical protein
MGNSWECMQTAASSWHTTNSILAERKLLSCGKLATTHNNITI